jgi:hypothetical protein
MLRSISLDPHDRKAIEVAMMCLTRHLRNLPALLIFGVAILLASPAPMRADPLPTVVGQCSDTTIERIGPRLVGHLESGIGVVYANGGTQVSYEVIAALQHSRRGDRVRLCLVSIPANCPPGDDRGRVYRATKLRTGESWVAPDARHSCGGA